MPKKNSIDREEKKQDNESARKSTFKGGIKMATRQIEGHKWKFEDERASSNLFDILMLAELGKYGRYSIFDHYDISIIGTVDGVLKEFKVKDITVSPEEQCIYVISENEKTYKVDFKESIEAFVEKYWDKST